jgi:hypothetical protein
VNLVEFFGFKLERKKSEEKETPVKLSSFVPSNDNDGVAVLNTGGRFGTYVDLSGDFSKSETDLLFKYRNIAAQPECDSAIEDIVNESIVSDHDRTPVDIVLDGVENISDKIKEEIKKEFEEILNLLQFNQYSHDIFRKWYIDGRLPYHMVIDSANPKRGILELRYIDPAYLKKVKEVQETKDPATGANLIVKEDEFYVYQNTSLASSSVGLKINKDAIVYCTSGILDPSRKNVLSHLHKVIKHVNNLRMMEDALVIYRMSRAPERRIFYIDVGNLPKGKAEEYVQSLMNKYRNKIVYDSDTGNLKDEKKHMSMLEDFWLPRREGGRGTEIQTLPGGENLGQIDDIEYFQRKLYKALNVPVSRLEPDTGFSLGRSSEISRDEVKFKRFIDRLRKRFSDVFNQLLRTQLIIKGVVTEKDWESISSNLTYDYIEDNYFSELKEAEIMRERFGMMRDANEYVGKYVSHEWIIKNVLRFNDDEIKEMYKQIDDENKSGRYKDQEDSGGGSSWQ